MSENVLILEDNLPVSQTLCLICKKLGFNFKAYESPQDAIENNDVKDADLIISDFDMVGGTALDLLQYMKDKGLRNTVLINSGNPQAKESIEKAGLNDLVTDYLDKFASISTFKNIILNNVR